MGNKHSVSDRAINNFSQSTRCFRGTEERGVILLAVELKYKQPFVKPKPNCDCIFNYTMLCIMAATTIDRAYSVYVMVPHVLLLKYTMIELLQIATCQMHLVWVFCMLDIIDKNR